MEKDAVFSECRHYRYLLYRIWDSNKPKAMCIGLNPSTANAINNDATITRLMSLLDNCGYGGLYMTNLFALISPYPGDLRMCPDPVKENDKWLNHVAPMCSVVIFCWGNFKQAEYRAKKIKQMFANAKCFGKNKNGSPKHPLYLKSNCSLVTF